MRYDHLDMLPENAFREDPLGRTTKEGGGGGGTTTSTGTTYTSDLPEWMKADYLNLIDRARDESLKPYEEFQGERVAGFGDLQGQAQDTIAGMGEPTGVTAAADKLANLQAPGSYDASTAQWIDPGVSEAYMNPYMQDVIDVSKRKAIEEGAKTQMQTDYEAQKAGAFGGDRFAIREAENARNLNERLGDIQVQGLSQAYESGAQKFEADRAAEIGQRQFGAGYEQQIAQFEQNLAESQARVGEAQQNLEAARAQLQNAVGAEQQALAQKELDAAYEEFANARDFERQNIAFMTATMRGTPVPTSQESIAYTPAASASSSLLGMGLSALGAAGTKS